MHTFSQTVIILSLLATYWCNGNVETEKINEIRQERTFRPSYSSSNVVSKTGSHSSGGDSSHYNGGNTIYT